MYSNKKSDHSAHSQRPAQPALINTGISDSLAGISFQPLSSSQAWAANPNSGGVTHKSSLPVPRPPEPRPTPLKEKHMTQQHVSASSLNTGLGDALKVTTGPRPSTNHPPVHRHDTTLQHPKVGGGRECLPSYRLIRRHNLPEEDSTSNYVFVDVNGEEFGYPIHAWRPVMQMCEAIYRDSHNSHLVKNSSLRAIRQVVQDYCKRGPFNLIPRSTIEHAVRCMLNAEFPSHQSVPLKHPRENIVSKTAIPEQPSTLSESYENRIRNYNLKRETRVVEPVNPSRARLDEYLAAKTHTGATPSLHEYPGAFTQKGKDARTVWLGLDFGTQNMKVAFRDGETDDQSVILELNPQASGIDRYLLSPSMRIKGNNLVFASGAKSETPSWKHALSAFYGDSYRTDGREIESWIDQARKQSEKIAARSTAELVLFFASMHLGFVLTRVGEEVKQYYRHQQIHDPLAFRVFMCAPVAAMDDQLSQLIFQDCLTIADQLHGILDFTEEHMHMEKALEAFDQTRKLGVLLEPRLSRRSRVVPEVIAEIASYAQSKSAREGVYALVDIGAGTLDLNVFKVVRHSVERGTTTPVFAASCHPNGVTHLETLLLGALGGVVLNHRELFEEQKQRMSFPDLSLLARTCAGENGDYKRHELPVMNAHQTYCKDVAVRTRKTWVEAWGKRGKEHDWQHLTMFLCGGGAAVHGIQKYLRAGMLDEIIERISEGVLPCPSEEEFVRPSNFPENEFHRVAVAYGLTFGSDFEPYLLPSQIHKLQIHRETEDISERYVPMDMV